MIDTMLKVSCGFGVIWIYLILIVSLTAMISNLFDLNDNLDIAIVSNVLQFLVTIGFIVYELGRLYG